MLRRLVALTSCRSLSQIMRKKPQLRQQSGLLKLVTSSKTCLDSLAAFQLKVGPDAADELRFLRRSFAHLIINRSNVHAFEPQTSITRD